MERYNKKRRGYAPSVLHKLYQALPFYCIAAGGAIMPHQTKITVIVRQGTQTYSRAALQALCSTTYASDKRQTSSPNDSCTVNAGTASSLARSSAAVLRA